MAEIHVRITDKGYKLWRTEKSGTGTKRRVSGVDVEIASLADLHEGLPIFLTRTARRALQEASNGSQSV